MIYCRQTPIKREIMFSFCKPYLTYHFAGFYRWPWVLLGDIASYLFPVCWYLLTLNCKKFDARTFWGAWTLKLVETGTMWVSILLKGSLTRHTHRKTLSTDSRLYFCWRPVLIPMSLCWAPSATEPASVAVATNELMGHFPFFLFF